MRAITLRPQWAYAVARLGKDIENRSWPLPAALHGQRVAIHAAATPPNRAELHDYVRRTQFKTANSRPDGTRQDWCRFCTMRRAIDADLRAEGDTL